MSAVGAVLAGREAAEAQMQDACQITRLGTPVLNETTLQYEPGPPTVIYTGKCRVASSSDSLGQTSTKVVEAGERAVYQATNTISVPMAVTDIQVDDVITITASLLDPDLVGRRYVMRGVEVKTHLTARRMLCIVMTA